MRHFKSVLAVLGAATILVLAGNTIVMAATGHSLLLGKSNSAGANTAITRTTSGSVLKLQSRYSSNSPLTVNGKGKVTNLNADMVDGLSSSTLRNHSIVLTKVIAAPTSNFTVDLPVPVGTYLFNYSAFLTGATSNVYCELYRMHSGSATTYVGIDQFTAGSNTPGLGGSGAITKAAGDTLSFQCGSSGSFTASPDTPIQIVMTPTTVTSTASLRTMGHPGARTAGH